MYMIASFECKFKTNQENIEKILQHFGLRKIQSSLYAGELENNEREMLVNNINEIIKEQDNVLIIPICQNCYSKKECSGREIKFKNDLYRCIEMKLIIDGYNKSIHKKDNQIVIHEKDEILDSIKASTITDITIVGKGYVTFDALNLMAENNIKLIAINPRGQLTYALESPNWRNIMLKKEQYKLSENKLGLEISKELIISKMKNQKATLTTLNKNKQLKRVFNHRSRIDECISQLSELNFKGKNKTIRMKIMGFEGTASNEYWSGVKHFIPQEIGFDSRTKKPTDLLNSMLNYGYAILASEITKSILLNGLDPYCGFLHFDMGGRTSLTFDLIEPFRQQIVDKTVIGLINKKQITVNDLDRRNNILKLEARKLIVKKILDKIYSSITYKNETLSYYDLVEKQSRDIVKVLIDGGKFNGFYLRW